MKDLQSEPTLDQMFGETGEAQRKPSQTWGERTNELTGKGNREAIVQATMTLHHVC